MIEDTINKGIPSRFICGLSRLDLINLSNNPKRTEKLIDVEFDKYVSYIEKCTDDDFHLYYPKGFATYTHEKTLKNVIVFNPYFISAPVYKFLNLCPDSLWEDLKKFCSVEMPFDNDLIETAINDLKNIKTEFELQKKFKQLYELYQRNKKTWERFKYLKLSYFDKKKDNVKLEIMKKIDLTPAILEKLEKYCDLKKFINKISNTLKMYVQKQDVLYEYAVNHYIPLSCFDDIDEEKLALYLAARHIHAADQAKDDKQEILYYVCSYFNDNNLRKYSDIPQIEYGYNNNNIAHFQTSPKKVYEKFKEFMLNNPELNFVDLERQNFNNMSLNDVESFMDKYFDELKLNWDFLLPNDEMIGNNILNDILKSYSNLSEEERKIKYNKAKELFMEKKKIFDSSKPYLILKGKNTFDGYIGYLYSNGKVILEKFFENSKIGKVAENQAIYVMNISKFYELSIKSKSDIIENNLCLRIVHQGNWQKKVIDAIESEQVADPELEVKKLLLINKK